MWVSWEVQPRLGLSVCVCVCEYKVSRKINLFENQDKKVFCSALYMTKLPVWEKQKNSDVGSLTFY